VGAVDAPSTIKKNAGTPLSPTSYSQGCRIPSGHAVVPLAAVLSGADAVRQAINAHLLRYLFYLDDDTVL